MQYSDRDFLVNIQKNQDTDEKKDPTGKKNSKESETSIQSRVWLKGSAHFGSVLPKFFGP